MAFTQLQYDTLISAIAQGARKVKYADKEVEYNSLDEMLKLKAVMEEDLGLSNKNRMVHTKYKSGLFNSNNLEGAEQTC